MGHKKHPHNPAPIPPANQPGAGSLPHAGDTVTPGQLAPGEPNNGAAFDEQDPQRRLGRYENAGQHSVQQPSPRRGDRD